MWLPPVLVFPPNRSRLEYTTTTNCWTRYCWSFQTSHLHCLKLNTGYSTVFYSVGSSNPTQRSWTMILTCTCTCTCTTVPSRCLYQAAALVIWCFSLSRYHFRCIIPPLMLRSLHPIEVVGIITKKKTTNALNANVFMNQLSCSYSSRIVWQFSHVPMVLTHLSNRSINLISTAPTRMSLWLLTQTTETWTLSNKQISAWWTINFMSRLLYEDI